MTVSFGAYVKALRGTESRSAVAKKAGFSAEYLRKIENTGQVPQKDKQLALARALKVEARELLRRALKVENGAAYRILTTVKARYPSFRRVLVKRLGGPGGSVILSDIRALPFSPHERQALILWSTALEMTRAGRDGVNGSVGEKALARARRKTTGTGYVEGQVCDFLAGNLTSWRADPETGRQTHLAGKELVGELLIRAGRALGLNRVTPAVPENGAEVEGLTGDDEMA